MAKKFNFLSVPVIVLVVIGILVLWSLLTYNGLVTKEQKVDAQWANVESQYQRRSDLIPNLVSSVQGYLQFERDLLTNITALRSQWQSSSTQEDRIKYGTELDSAISRLLVVVENYPELKSDTTVVQLMDELAGTENRIAVERMRYNNDVRDFNGAIRRIPGSIIASMFGFEQKLYFSSTPGSEVAPDVNIYP